MSEEYVPSLDEIREIFFRVMTTSSWASGGKKRPGPEPESWQVAFDEESWHVRDQWFVIPGTNRTLGKIIVFFGKTPVWVMQFHGEYTKEASDFVKQVVLASYHARKFRGGRGRNGTQNERLVYLTTHYQPASFTSFNFLEEVYDFRTNECQGWHRVSGMVLI